MEHRYIIFALIGFATLIMAWMPSISKKIKVSYPIIILAIGFVMFYARIPIPIPEPIWKDKWLLYFSELIVIVSVMGAGLKIGNIYSLQAWKKPLLLILITMPLGMLAVYFLGKYFLLLSLPSSLLLAAVLAPTDPVLASETQLDDPTREKKQNDKVRFSLTAEAGINDGAAFPFTYMAVMVGQAGGFVALDFSNWFWDKLLLKIIIGAIVGLVLGKLVGVLLDRLQKKTGIETFDGFLALSLTLLTYGVSEMLHGYGFVAVFGAGWAIRYYEKVSGDHKKKMHDFIDEVERVLLVLWLLLFSGAIMNGLLSGTSWKGIVFSFVFVLLVRPITGLIGLIGVKENLRNKLVVSFLGIRGIGSVFYLAWAFYTFDGFKYKAELYAITSYIILISIVIHGLSAPSIIKYLEKSEEEKKNHH